MLGMDQWQLANGTTAPRHALKTAPEKSPKSACKAKRLDPLENEPRTNRERAEKSKESAPNGPL